MKKLSIIVFSSLLLHSCVSYTHVMDAPQLTSAEKGLSKDAFAFKGTYAMGGFINENSSNFQIIDSSNVDFYEKNQPIIALSTECTRFLVRMPPLPM